MTVFQSILYLSLLLILLTLLKIKILELCKFYYQAR